MFNFFLILEDIHFTPEAKGELYIKSVNSTLVYSLYYVIRQFI